MGKEVTGRVQNTPCHSFTHFFLSKNYISPPPFYEIKVDLNLSKKASTVTSCRSWLPESAWERMPHEATAAPTMGTGLTKDGLTPQDSHKRVCLAPEDQAEVRPPNVIAPKQFCESCTCCPSFSMPNIRC